MAIDKRLVKAVRELCELGYKPYPCLPGEKHPLVEWAHRSPDYLPWPAYGAEYIEGRGIWTPTGRPSRRLVLDPDNEAAVELWRDRLGQQFDTAQVETARGIHLHFMLNPGQVVASWTWQKDEEAVGLGAHYEVCAEGKGVMLPPSSLIGPGGQVLEGRYRWLVPPEQALPCPRLLFAPPGGTRSRRTGQSERSKLAQLLAEANGVPEGNRNEWHSKVAGHLALSVRYPDAFVEMGLVLNRVLVQPLDEAEVRKTWTYRWEASRAGVAVGDANSGYLSGDGRRLYTTIRGAPTSSAVVAPIADADLKARGVIETSEGIGYAVDIHYADGEHRRIQIPAGTLGSREQTSKLLSRWRIVPLAPMAEAFEARNTTIGLRIQRYLESQHPPQFSSISWLGWHARHGFVCHEGIIDAEGLKPHDTVVPDQQLVELAPYRYGFGSTEVAISLLREILTFQERQVCAVFGAWWATCLLKGQIVDAFGIFPYFAIGAASEAGKTTGFFQLMLELAGSKWFGTGTKAAIRDAIGAHRSGIVHIDDPDTVEHLDELLRQAANEGILSKKADGNVTTTNIKLVAPILVSGEALGLSIQKAHRDRSVQIEVSSPVGRKSLHDPSKPQLDDIRALRAAHPDLAEYAGSLVRLALIHGAELLPRLSEFRHGTGRQGDVQAILRMGARLLAAMIGHDPDWVVQEVDDWCFKRTETFPNGNTLITSILPWAVLEFKHRTSSIGNPPLYINSKHQIMVHPGRLADIWGEHLRRVGRTDRLGNEAALRAQLHAIGAGVGKPRRVISRTSGKNINVLYYQIPSDIAVRLLRADA